MKGRPIVIAIDGEQVYIRGSADIELNPRIMDYTRIPMDRTKIERHEIPSAGLVLPQLDVKDLILTLETAGYGFGGVYLHTDPHFGQTNIYDSHSDLGAKTPTEVHMHKAKGVYHDILSMIRKGNFKVHLFSHGVIGLE